MVNEEPTTPVKGTKAIVATVLSAILAGITFAIGALSDGVISSGEWLGVAAAIIVGSGVVGTATYQTVNKPK